MPPVPHREIWKPVPGFDGYEVSDIGRVRSYRIPGCSGRSVMARILELSVGPTGHIYAGFRKNGVTINGQLGNWMLLAFVGPPADNQECLHADDNPKNNKLSNLRWGTRLENVRDRLRNGRHNLAKLTVDDVRKIKELLKTGMYGKDVAAMFSISGATVSEIKTGKIWQFVD